MINLKIYHNNVYKCSLALSEMFIRARHKNSFLKNVFQCRAPVQMREPIHYATANGVLKNNNKKKNLKRRVRKTCLHMKNQNGCHFMYGYFVSHTHVVRN